VTVKPTGSTKKVNLEGYTIYLQSDPHSCVFVRFYQGANRPKGFPDVMISLTGSGWIPVLRPPETHVRMESFFDVLVLLFFRRGVRHNCSEQNNILFTL